jgi:hypothetical protein
MSQQKRVPHKHAEVIKAWADGAQIQFRNPCKGITGNIIPLWTDYTSKITSPGWLSHVEYRVKPTPVVRFMTVGSSLAASFKMHEQGIPLVGNHRMNLKLTFEDEVLITAEVL